MPIIEIRNLNKSFSIKLNSSGFIRNLKSLFSPEYKTVTAVKNLNLQVKKGETLAFIGPNGAGKSTTIKMLTCILFPTSGDADVLGLNPWKDRQKLAFEIGTVFGQRSQLWIHLPAIDTFFLLSKIYELDSKQYEERKNYLVKLFGLHDLILKPVRKLSLGERMKCEIVASLLHRPKVLFLDEPTIGLDVVAKHDLRNLIKKINTEEGVTIFLTSHDAGDVENICKRAIVINHGEKIFDGTVASLKNKYLNEKIIDLKTSRKLKIIPGRGYKVVLNADFQTKIEVDTKIINVTNFVSKFLSRESVDDINITEAPMEEVIAKIYKDS